MFFKAGAYTGNNTSPEPEKDFDKVIFYKLDYAHDPAPAISEAEKAKSGHGRAHPARRRGHGRHSRGGLCNAGCEAPLPPAKAWFSTTTLPTAIAATAPMQSDSNWWTTTNSTAIEVNKGRLGSSRQFRARHSHDLAPQNLAQGQTLKATFNFTTPGYRRQRYRFGIAGRDLRQTGSEQLESDQSASSNAPNAAYDGLPGYMIDFDRTR